MFHNGDIARVKREYSELSFITENVIIINISTLPKYNKNTIIRVYHPETHRHIICRISIYDLEKIE